MYGKQTRLNRNSSSAHIAATSQFAQKKSFVQPQIQEGVQQQESISAAEVEKIRAAGSNWPDVSMFTTNRPAPAPRPRIQRKLSIGKAGDKYEQEADNVARQVVDQIHPSQSPSV
jgi:rhamnose utilization protein RhaD (predicted bifunctional aldolase and dehydrogenase)